MKSKKLQFGLIILTLLIPLKIFSQNTTDQQSAIEKTQKLLTGLVKNSYPKLENKKIKVKTFKSESSYFKTRFSFSKFLKFQKINYIVFVNPGIYQSKISEEAVIAILAHELAHIVYYTEKNRLELLGLAGLIDKSFTAKFERKADLQVIKRGYGEGLIKYREWLYEHIPQKNLNEKKRSYFTPEEIKAIMAKPEKIDFWLKNVPRSLSEIN
ncbi:MAG: hypothetical protein ABIP06_07215 [Pyrinomonadaceae bacterium]